MLLGILKIKSKQGSHLEIQPMINHLLCRGIEAISVLAQESADIIEGLVFDYVTIFNFAIIINFYENEYLISSKNENTMMTIHNFRTSLWNS